MTPEDLPTPPMSSQTSQAGDALSSSPCPVYQAGNKQKGKPTITPRSFGRFFDPKRSSSEDGSTIKSKNSLVKPNASQVNARSRHHTRHQIFDEDENPTYGSNNFTKRRHLASPDTSPERDSQGRPTKRTKLVELEDDLSDCSSEDLPVPQNLRFRPLPSRVRRAEYRGVLGTISNREIGNSGDSYRRISGDHYTGEASTALLSCR